MQTTTLHIQKDGETVLMGSRGRGNGLDTRKARVVSIEGDLLTLHVPGHSEVNGYDRMGTSKHGGMTTREYVRAATHELRIVRDYGLNQFGQRTLEVTS